MICYIMYDYIYDIIYSGYIMDSVYIILYDIIEIHYIREKYILDKNLKRKSAKSQ